MVMSSELLFENALKAQKCGRLKEALEMYEKIIAQDSTHAAALNNLGVVRLGLGEYEKSLECFERVCAVERTDSDAFFNLGKVYFLLKKYELSLKAFKMAEKFSHGDYLILKNLGTVHIELKQYPEALLNFRHMLSIRKDDWEPYYLMAKAHFMKKEIEISEKLLETARELNPSSREVLLLLSELYRISKKEDDRENLLGMIYDLYPGDQEVFTLLVECCRERNKEDKARRIVEGFLTDNPFNFQANRFLREFSGSSSAEKENKTENSSEQNVSQFESLFQNGDLDGAMKILNEFLLQKGNIESVENFISCLEKSERLSDAVHILEKIYSRTGSERYLFEKGRILLESGNTDEARKLFLERASVSSSPWPAYYLGKLSLNEGKIEDAISYLEKSVQQAGDFSDGSLLLGEIFLSRGDLYHAHEYFSRVLRFYPDNHTALYHMARIYDQEGEIDRAVKMYARYLDRVEDYQVLDRLARLWLLQKQIKNARQIWLKLSDISPKSTEEMIFRARALLFSDETELAVRQLKMAENAEPRLFNVQFYLGICHLIQSNLTEALNFFYRAWQTDQKKFTEEAGFVFRYLNKDRLLILISVLEDQHSPVALDISTYLRTILGSR